MLRTVQLNSNVVAEIKQYLRLRGHETLANVAPEIPLIASLPVPGRPGSADYRLSTPRLYKVLKGFLKDVVTSLLADDLEMAQKLRSGSTLWLRHTFATHGIHNGMALETIRDLLGHKSLNATSVYVTTERDNRSREVEKLGDLTAF